MSAKHSQLKSVAFTATFLEPLSYMRGGTDFAQGCPGAGGGDRYSMLILCSLYFDNGK